MLGMPKICRKAGSDMGGTARPEKAKGFALLQNFTSKSRTQDLLGAYNELKNKPLAKMSTEERAAFAAVTDELANRSKIVMDNATGAYVPNPSGKKIVYIPSGGGMDRAYRVDKVRKTPDGTYYADAKVLVNGRWSEVKGWELQKRIAQAARRGK